jgi:23S rRNA (adenine2030-N6)-methyltransferase
VSLAIVAPSADGFGMHGSGMFVLNPPWNLEAPLREAMPALVGALGQAGAASFDLQFQQT